MGYKYELESRTCDTCGGSVFEEVHRTKNIGASIVIEDGDRLVHDTDVMCMNCGLIYKMPMMSKKSMDKFYVEEYSGLFRPGYKETISRQMVVYTLMSSIQISDWLKTKLKVEGMDVLDIGAGDGMFMKCMEGLGCRVVGIDQDKRGIEIAKKLSCIDIIEGDFMEVLFEHKFDLVCCRNTLEHMYSPSDALAKAMTLMKDDGHILVEVPCAYRPYAAGNSSSFLSAAHNYTFTIESLSQLCEKVGLNIQEVSYDGHHGCMMILLSKADAKVVVPNNPKQLFDAIKERYAEHDKTFFNINEIIKELLASTNVNNSIGQINSYKHTSNNIVYMLITTLLGRPEQREFLAEILDTYKWDDSQAHDTNCCEASFQYVKGMFYRELGDFTLAKQHVDIALSMYPDVLSKNFVKELILEGVISESVFGEYLWYSCYKQSEML